MDRSHTREPRRPKGRAETRPEDPGSQQRAQEALGIRSQPQRFLEAIVQPATAQSGHKGLGAASPTEGYVGKENRLTRTSLRKRRSGPTLSSNGKIDRHSRGAAGQGLGKPTNRCSAKETSSLTDVPLGLEGRTDRRVHR